MNTGCHGCCTLASLVLSSAPPDIDTAFSRSFTVGSKHRTGHEAYEKAFS